MEEQEKHTINSVRQIAERMLVLEWERDIWVIPVEQILGIHHLPKEDLKNVPETVARSANTYTKGIFSLHGKDIAYLDHDLMLHGLKRSIH